MADDKSLDDEFDKKMYVHTKAEREAHIEYGRVIEREAILSMMEHEISGGQHIDELCRTCTFIKKVWSEL